MNSRKTFVIVGAGLAGAKAAETLRTEGFAGRVVLLGDEQERPYERPPLSKDYLRGETRADELFVHDHDFYDDHGIELVLGRTAVRLDTSTRDVTLDDGARLRYDRLLLATGAEPFRPGIPGGDLDGVLYLRSKKDSDALRERFQRGGAVVVVGAGWIGSEVAASARELGLAVTVIDPLSVPLERVLGRAVGAVYHDLHSDHGVSMLMGTSVDAFLGDEVVERVRTRDGREIAVRPRGRRCRRPDAHPPRRAGRHHRRRRRARRPVPAIEHPEVFAAGDVANAAHPHIGGRVRVEHWSNALHQGPAAARNMLGLADAYTRLPYFFSDQYDVGMEYSGFARSWDRVVFRGDAASREFIAFWLAGDRVVAGMNVNVWGVSDPIRALIASGAPVDDRRLADPDVPLDRLAAAPSRGSLMNRLRSLHDAGVAIWLDTLSRELSTAARSRRSSLRAP